MRVRVSVWGWKVRVVVVVDVVVELVGSVEGELS